MNLNASCAMIIAIIILLISGAKAQNLTSRNFNSDCGQVFTQNQFIIETPRYPSNYPINYQCSYLVKGPTCPTSFHLQFLDFQLEDSLGCAKDRLEIEDKDAICGSQSSSKDYFSEKGTLILRFVSDNNGSGRGYRILVTRSPCQTTETETSTLPEWYTTSKDVEVTTKRTKFDDSGLAKCCQKVYTAKRFFITSPNFPYSMSTPTDCTFQIHKSNRNVCRIRIHLQFFWLGWGGEKCREGFLELDGKYLCGCKTDMKIISPFLENSPKNFRFLSRGYEQNSMSGFVAEIIQDECPKKYTPETTDNFRFYNDQINRVAWPSQVEKLKLISENTEVLEAPRIVKHVYFFAEREPRRDREETDYVDTSMAETIPRDSYDYNYCLAWNRQQILLLSSRNLPQCKVEQGNAVNRECVELDYVRGYFKSPGYPMFYPGNLNICYRFKKSPGYCAIRLHMKDFNLEASANCYKDYVLFENQLKYCGNGITNTISIIDLSRKPYEEMHFITDSFQCGRGFYGTYEQIQCENKIPDNSMPPSTMTPCYRTIQDQLFTLDIYDYNEQTCEFVIKKATQGVCAIKLYFEKFELFCASEALIIDGMMYCGHLTGQSVTINLRNQDTVISYKKRSNAGIAGLRLRIQGMQIINDCPNPEVPAERLLKTGKSLESQFVLKMNQDFRHVCGIITNTTETKLPESFCELLMKNDGNVTECLPLKENSLIVPLGNSEKIELKVKDVPTSEDLEFEEINCDDMQLFN